MGVSNDPAQALAGGGHAASPGGQPRDLVGEYFQHMRGTTVHDQAKANAILVELNRKGMKEQIAQITAQLEAAPIRLSGI